MKRSEKILKKLAERHPDTSRSLSAAALGFFPFAGGAAHGVLTAPGGAGSRAGRGVAEGTGGAVGALTGLALSRGNPLGILLGSAAGTGLTHAKLKRRYNRKLEKKAEKIPPYEEVVDRDAMRRGATILGAGAGVAPGSY